MQLIASLYQRLNALYSPHTSPAGVALIEHELISVRSSSAQLPCSSRLWLTCAQFNDSAQSLSILRELVVSDDAHTSFFGASSLAYKVACSPSSAAWLALLSSPAHEEGDASTSDRGADGKEELALARLADAINELAAWHAPRRGRSSAAVLSKLADVATALSARRCVLATTTRSRAKFDPDWLLKLVTRLAAATASSDSSQLLVLLAVFDTLKRVDLVGTARNVYTDAMGTAASLALGQVTDSLSRNDDSSAGAAAALQVLAALLSCDLVQLSSDELDGVWPTVVALATGASASAQAAKEACLVIEDLLERASYHVSASLNSARSLTAFLSRQRTEVLVQAFANSPRVAHALDSLATADNDAEDADDDEDLAACYARLVCALATHFLSFALHPPPGSQPYLTLTSAPAVALMRHVLRVTLLPWLAAHEHALDDIAADFWLELQESCMSGELQADDEALVHDLVDAQWRGTLTVANWRSIGDRPTTDTVDDFARARQSSMRDLLSNAYYVRREHGMLAPLLEMATREMDAGAHDADALEATLYALSSVQEAVPEREDMYLPTLLCAPFYAALSAPALQGRSRLHATALDLTRSYAAWFAGRGVLLNAIEYVVHQTAQPEVAAAAASAMGRLCATNRKALTPHVASLTHVLASLDGQVDDAELDRILEAVTSVVQAVEPPDARLAPLLQLVTPTIDSGLLAASTYAARRDPQARELALMRLARLARICRGLRNPDEDLLELDPDDDPERVRVREEARRAAADERFVALRARFAEMLATLASASSGDAELVQAICDVVRESTADETPTPLSLDPFALVRLCASDATSATWLSTLATLMGRLARTRSDRDISPHELELLSQPVRSVMHACLSALPDLGAMSAHPDLVEGLVRFAFSVVRHYPSVYAPDLLDATCRFCTTSVRVAERFSLGATVDLQVAIIQQTRMASSSAETFSRVLSAHIAPLVTAVVGAIASDNVPRSALSPLSELMHALVLRCPDDTRAALAQLNVDDSFSKAILRARTGKQARAAVADFASVARGLQGTASGRTLAAM